jgi:cell division protein ZapB
MYSLTVAGAVQALPAGDSGTRTCFPFHSPRAEREVNTHAVSRKRNDYSPAAACAAPSGGPAPHIRKHIQNHLLFLDAMMVLQHSARVEAEFSALEAKVAQFVNVCDRLRAENIDLRQQLVAAQNDAKRLTDKIEGAKVKLESLISRLPD